MSGRKRKGTKSSTLSNQESYIASRLSKKEDKSDSKYYKEISSMQ